MEVWLSPGNHTGYMQFKGTKTSPQEIRDLYDGLKQSSLNDFDMLLTGYIPGAEAVAAVGTIARDLKLRASIRPGSFFWGTSNRGKRELRSGPSTNQGRNQRLILSWVMKASSTLTRMWCRHTRP